MDNFEIKESDIFTPIYGDFGIKLKQPNWKIYFLNEKQWDCKKKINTFQKDFSKFFRVHTFEESCFMLLALCNFDFCENQGN